MEDDKIYFETTSIILPDENNDPDVKRFIGRINYESMCSLDGTIENYCKKLKLMINNHIEIEQYEIAAGLQITLDQLTHDTTR